MANPTPLLKFATDEQAALKKSQEDIEQQKKLTEAERQKAQSASSDAERARQEAEIVQSQAASRHERDRPQDPAPVPPAFARALGLAAVDAQHELIRALAQATRPKDRHTFIQEARAHIKTQCQTPTRCRIAGFFQQFAFGCSQLSFAGINLSSGQLPEKALSCMPVLPL